MTRYIMLLVFIVIGSGATAQLVKDSKEDKKLEKQKRKHQRWNPCFIVRASGDTIFVNAAPPAYNDYCTTGGGISFTPEGFKIAYSNDEEQVMPPEQMREMFVYSTHSHYMVIAPDEGEKFIAKVLVEGPCRLLLRDVYVSGGATVSSNHSAVMPATTTTYSPGANLGWYYTLYNGQLTQLLSGNQPALIAKTLAKNCSKVFSSCATVMAEINAKKLTREDLPGLVKDFNQCLGDASFKPFYK